MLSLSNQKIRVGLAVGLVIAATLVFFQKQINLGLDLQGGTQLVLEGQETPEHAVDPETMDGILNVIRGRVDGLGVSEPILQRKGLKQIIVELPGVKDPDHAIKIIGDTALLEFVEAEWAPENLFILPPDKQELLVGKGAHVEKVVSYGKDGRVVSERPIVLKRTVLTGADLKSAVPGTDDYGRPIVNIEFTANAARVFHEVTARQVGKPLAILLDGKIISAPNVNGPIPGGRAYIEGNFGIQEMRDLVLNLKAGSLPVPVKIVSHRVVGPTLGRDSVEKSKHAGLVAFVIVCAYIVYLYRIPGLIACLCLSLYVFLVISTLKFFDATLTLPGIAGIILTIGMAVDANVIIFERIREEIGLGENLATAISNGFKHGFVAVFDANVTTLISALVLFWFGTSTIRGFGITLGVGIVASMFTAVFVSRLLLEGLARWQPSLKLFRPIQRAMFK